MTVNRARRESLCDKYRKVKRYLETTGQSLEPYPPNSITKDEAMQILLIMEANLKQMMALEIPDSDDFIKITAMLGATLLILSKATLEKEDMAASEAYLKECEDTIKDYHLHPEVAIVAVSFLNDQGLYWLERDPEKAKICFQRVEVIYNHFKSVTIVPVDFDDVFTFDPSTYHTEKGMVGIENGYSLAVFNLAQIYKEMGDGFKSSIYCHLALEKQLEMADMDKIAWALNCAILGQCFMERNGFKQARHHLAAGLQVLMNEDAKLKENVLETEEYKDKVEHFNKSYAEVARCWAKYGLILLKFSSRYLLSKKDIKSLPSTDLVDLDVSAEKFVKKEDLTKLAFNNLDVQAYESQITNQFVLTLEDAKPVFLNAQKWLTEALKYYTLESFATDHIEIVQEQSALYQHLTLFDDDVDSKAKMHKRRVDILEKVVKEVNPAHYLKYCREMWNELAGTYEDMLDLKKEKLMKQTIIWQGPSHNPFVKINSIIEKSIQHYTSFINSFRDAITKEFPKSIEEDMVVVFLLTYFHIGALWEKYFIFHDKLKKAECIENGWKAYKKITDYFASHPECQGLIPTERSICEEMVALLPLKIKKLRVEASFSF